jgi:hypothetical protein
MIDWYNLASNALWIFALALALAVFSFAYWERCVTGERMRVILAKPRWEVGLNLAGTLFCLGLAATSDRIWGRVLWLVLMGLYLVQTSLGIWKRRRAGRSRVR